MPDGRMIFRHCIPDGAIDLYGVDPGAVVQREMTFRCNAAPELQEVLDSGSWDPRTILIGSDGELLDENGTRLAQVNAWSSQATFNNIDYDPAGESITWSIPNRYTFTLTLTETVINDTALLQKILNGLTPGGRRTYLTFQGVLRSHNVV